MSGGRKATDTRTTGPVGAPVARASAPDPLAETRLAEPDEGSPFDTDRIAPSLPTALFERYKIKRKLGAGGMGVVYEALDLNLHRVIALKVLKLSDEDPSQLAEAANRLVREARAMAVLSHKNVVTVYDVGMHGLQVYVAMQLVDGVTLRHWLGGHARKTSDILRVLCDAGSGLAAAHRARLVHRDFKPDNVLVSRRGTVRVTDFGLARRANFSGQEEPVNERTSRPKVLDEHSVENVTRSGAILGTPAYMPPEQSEGRPCDARADQFSFCVTAWEALYGTRPFAGTTWSQLYSNLISGNIVEPDTKRRVPRLIQKALRRGLAVDPAERFATMDELLEILETGIERPKVWLRYVVIPAASAIGAGVITTMLLRDDPPPAASKAPVPVAVEPATKSAPISSVPIAAAVPTPAVPTPAPVETAATAAAHDPAPAKADPKPKRKVDKAETAGTTGTIASTTNPVVEAPPAVPKVDPLAAVRTKRRGLDAKAKERGLLAADLPRAAAAALEEADAAIGAGDPAKAESAIAAADKAIEAVLIDYAFINAKLARINRQLSQSAGREDEFRALFAQLKSLVNAKKYGEANTLLNDMAARLAKK